MKTLTILSTVALASTSAMAIDTKMSLKGRFDYVRTESKPTTTTTTKTASGEYRPGFMKLVTTSKLNDTVKAKLVLDLSQNAAAVNNVLSNFVDEAHVTKTMGSFSAIIGRQMLYTGGFERLKAGRDLYVKTRFHDYKALRTNRTGVTLSYTFMDQTLYLQHLELDANNAGPTITDKKATGLAYHGKFMDGMVSPIASYYKVGTARLGQYDVYTNLGVKVAAMDFVFEFDYMMLNEEKYGANAAGTVVDAELTTMLAHVKYNHENFKPFLKFIKEEGEKSSDALNSVSYTAQSTAAVAQLANNADKTERSAFELGLEYVPSKDEDMRYHLVYNTSEVKETTGTTKYKHKNTTMYAGVAFGVDLF